MKIIITAAGLGSRFKKMGIYTPTYKIKVKEKTIYELAMLSLRDFFDEEFIFIFRTEIFDKEFLDIINKKIGIKNYKFKIIDECTEGQATTAFKSSDLVNDNESVIIYNINTHIKPYIINKNDIKNDIDAFLPIYKLNYIKEKIDYIEYMPVGFFYFKKWRDYKEIYNKYISYIKIKNKEACIEGMYEYLIKDNKIVETKILEDTDIYKLNTPQSIKFLKEKLN